MKSIRYFIIIISFTLWSFHLHANSLDNNKNEAIELATTEYYSARRFARFFVVDLKSPHQVFSTSAINGGFVDTIQYLINYQSMEAHASSRQIKANIEKSKMQYHNDVAEEIGLPPDKVALMGTAANINNLVHARKDFGELRVDAFVTAGVRGNALRAGDPTSWIETEEGNKSLDVSGTINTIVMINQPLTAGAQAKAAMLMVEAKAAGLAELMVPSTVSSHLATGTGTDQFIIASPIDSNKYVNESASGHLKLGELIGSAVKEATVEAIRWQNRLERSNYADLIYLFTRFGLTQDLFLEKISKHLTPDQYDLASKNYYSLTADARVVAAVTGYVQLLDRFQYDNLPNTIRSDALRDQAAQVAIALAGKPAKWRDIWVKLSLDPKAKDAAIDLLIEALALGWVEKWDQN